MSSRKFKVLVLGAGISGVSSALRILESCDNVDVTVMAAAFSPNTTSDGTAGFWEVFSAGGTDARLLHALSQETYNYLRNLSFSDWASVARVEQMSGYQLQDTTIEKDHDFKDIVDGYRALTREELARWPTAKDGRFFTSVAVEVTPYLKWLTERIISKGGHFVKRTIHSLQELSSQWDVIVNCMGLGSHKVLGDHDMYPIRGQVFKVRAPWLSHFCILDTHQSTTYVLPNVDYVTVGGTFQTNDWREEVNDEDAKDIWDRAVKLVPSVKGATIMKTWAGLRPVRTSLRLETEVVDIKEEHRELHVVHNYGHGGAGITLHWGCAGRTAEMVVQTLKNKDTENRVNHEKRKTSQSKL